MVRLIAMLHSRLGSAGSTTAHLCDQVAALVALVRELRLELFSLKKAEQVLDGLLKQARPLPMLSLCRLQALCA